MTKRRNPEQPDRGLDAVMRGTETALTALGFGKVFGLWRGLVGSSVERKMNEYVLPRLDALVAKQRTLRQRIVESEEFAYRIEDIVHRLTRTAQEEKRQYLCNGLLRMACEDIAADEATHMLSLIDTLTVAHITILCDITENLRLKDTDSPPELRPHLKVEQVWSRVNKKFFGERPERAARQRFDSLVLHLEGLGLIQKSWASGDATPDHPIPPTELAERLLEFITDPTES